MFEYMVEMICEWMDWILGMRFCKIFFVKLLGFVKFVLLLGRLVSIIMFSCDFGWNVMLERYDLIVLFLVMVRVDWFSSATSFYGSAKSLNVLDVGLVFVFVKSVVGLIYLWMVVFESSFLLGWSRNFRNLVRFRVVEYL